MEFDMGKCQLMQRVKGQLSVTDRFTVHEDQITQKSSVQENPRRARPCCHNMRLISGQLEST